jgi:hypothetical protein
VRLTIFAVLLALTVRGLFARRMGWRVASAGLLAFLLLLHAVRDAWGRVLLV